MDEQLPSTAERSPSRTKQEIIKEAQRIEETVLYSSKGHLVSAVLWRRFHLAIGIPTVLLSGLAGAAALSSFDPNHLVAGSLSIVVAALSAVSTFLNPNEAVSAHRAAGSSYDSLMNRVRIFRSIDCWREESEQVLTERIKRFSEEKDDLNSKCPQIGPWAYRKAKKGILAGEAKYAVDGPAASLQIK
jgi:hypothetical protein